MYRAAVSLHCHTHHSREHLGYIPRYATRIPVIASFFNRERDRYFRLKGKVIDFTGWYWTPPVTVEKVLDSETERIERQLGLQALISVTDHNDISTSRLFQTPQNCHNIPTSLEWTVPVDGGALHLGVHNLPSEASSQIVNELLLHTRKSESKRVKELLASLNGYPETLVVLNHPMSDIESLGIGRLKTLVMGFLKRYGRKIHALEINGYRSWNENRATVALAEQFGLPVVSGGDRHGRAPNAVLNLTNATRFSEFVSEIRYDKLTQLLIMPEYWEDLFTRKLEAMAEFFRYYPEYPPGLQRWTDRVFIPVDDGVVRPVSHYWEQTVPLWVKSAMWLVRLVRSKYLQPAVRMAFSRKAREASWEVQIPLPGEADRSPGVAG